MHNEITAAVIFLVRLIEKNEKFSPDQLECFKQHLIKSLTERFKNHWFPDKPFKGQGYRCIRVNGNNRRDASLESAANAAGVKYEDLSLPIELTLWVDPNEVCCRFGENKGSYCTLASFNDKENLVIKKDIEPLKHWRLNSKIKESLALSYITTDFQPKSKPLCLVNQNQQPTNNSTGRKRNINSPKYTSRNRIYYTHALGMTLCSIDHGMIPYNQPWYNMPLPIPLGLPRGDKWGQLPTYSAGSRFAKLVSHWPTKPTLKV